MLRAGARQTLLSPHCNLRSPRLDSVDGSGGSAWKVGDGGQESVSSRRASAMSAISSRRQTRAVVLCMARRPKPVPYQRPR